MSIKTHADAVSRTTSHVIDWESEDDPGHPFNWPKSKKWSVTLAALYVCFIVGLNSTMIAGASTLVTDQFDVSDDNFPNDFWPIAAWNAGAAVAPLIGLPLMEHFGVRESFLVYYILFMIFIIPQALASNFATLLVTRVIAGGLGSIVQNSVESVISDTWRDEEERNLPITIFVFLFVAGFTAGPVFGAAIISSLSWRWVFYVQLIIYGASFPLLYILLKETRHSVILGRRAKALKKRTGQPYYIAGASHSASTSSLIYEAVIRPTRLFCTEPTVFLFTLWSAFAFGLVFISTQSIGQVYITNYNFTLPQTGYVQAALVVGEALGCLACLPQNSYYMRSARRNPINPGKPIAEARLPLSIPASFLGLSGGLFWYAWSSNNPSIHWIVPTIGLGLVGFGITIVVQSVVMYLTDSYIQFAGSAIAAEAFGENIFAAFLPLATKKMYTSLGFGWASSLLGFAALVLSFAPILLFWKGPVIRERSKFLKRYGIRPLDGDTELLQGVGSKPTLESA